MNQHTHNSGEDAWGRLLGDGLRAHLDQHGHPTYHEGVTMSDVQNRAGRITRNRRIGIAVAALAVVGIVGPVAALNNGGLFKADKTPVSGSPTAAPTSGATQTSQTSPTPTPSTGTQKHYKPGTPVVLAKLPVGADTAVPWAEIPAGEFGGVIHTSPGGTFELPDARLVQFAPAGNGWVLRLVDRNEKETIYLVTDENGLGRPYRTQGRFAVSPNGELAAWVGIDGKVRVAAGTRVSVFGQMNGAGPFSVAGISGDMSCTGGAECAVHVNDDGPAGSAPTLISTDGTTTLEAKYVTTVGATGYGAIVSVTGDGSCSQWWSLRSGPQWRTCANTLGPVSPGDQGIIGYPAYQDGLGSGVAELLDATSGKPLAQWPGSRRSVTYTQGTWESPTASLWSVLDPMEKPAIVRLSTDGSAELLPGSLIDPGARILLPER